MIKERAEELVGVLRSGLYRQGRMSLKDATGGYCCLGVACEISGVGKWEEGVIEGERVYKTGPHDYDHMVLPWAVMKHFGFSFGNGTPSTEEPVVEIDGIKYGCLSEANDSGKSFAQIADWIEVNWEIL